MKIDEKSINKFNQNNETTDDLFDDLLFAMQDDEPDDDAFIKTHPGAAAMAAAALVGMPAAGIGIASIGGQAAELGTDTGAANATFVDINDGNDTLTSEDTQDIVKDVHFTVDGPGHFEAVSNCVIDAPTGTIHFENADENASFKFVRDVEGASADITMNGQSMQSEDDVITLEAHSDYSDINAKFVDVVAQQKAEEEARAAEQAAQEAQAAQQAASQARASSNYTQAARSTTPAKATNGSGGGGTVQVAAPQAAAPQAASTASPSSGAAQNSMTGDELAEAHAIFDSYNNWRASKGLSRVAWSDDCANMAYGSSTGCAARGQLVHRLGIPGSVQNSYSDILQYSTWKMSGDEAVNRWSNSTGHRKMMQCNTATQAGVGVYNNNGVWYYSIVYNFSGCNQSGA